MKPLAEINLINSKMLVSAVILITCIKLLLIPAYHSTDFEVHRNWLAITYNLPVNKWYFEDTSEWTLDYPPIFAWFEYLLSLFAQYFDKSMLIVENLNYKSSKAIFFQRVSVIISDFIYAYGVKQCSSILPQSWQTNVVLPLLLLGNIGLLMVDHIHFQYNGIMYGILLISIVKLLKEQYVYSAFWFSLLLNMKHIFMYLAPAYFIYMLRNYCLKKRKTDKYYLIAFSNLFKLGFVVTTMFFITFIPFYDHINQILSRMFPFKRGLCHAYWAPNVWAMYNLLDKATAYIGMKLNMYAVDQTASMTAGLVQEYSHSVLPSITPLITVILTGIFMVPGMIKMWNLGKSPLNFLRFLVICALTSFLFGWHVHEKAILMAIIPLRNATKALISLYEKHNNLYMVSTSLYKNKNAKQELFKGIADELNSILSIMDAEDARIYLILSTTGFYSLFPLLYPHNLLYLKVVLIITYSSYAFYSLRNLYPLRKCEKSLPLLNLLESTYLLGLVFLFLYENVIHIYFELDKKLPFLPLMLISSYCAIGIIYSWARYYVVFILRTK